jgi:hypothetical protein
MVHLLQKIPDQFSHPQSTEDFANAEDENNDKKW